MGDESNIVSLAEWKRVKNRLARMTLPELAMTTHSLIDLMIDLNSHLLELKEELQKLQKASK